MKKQIVLDPGFAFTDDELTNEDLVGPIGEPRVISVEEAPYVVKNEVRIVRMLDGRHYCHECGKECWFFPSTQQVKMNCRCWFVFLEEPGQADPC